MWCLWRHSGYSTYEIFQAFKPEDHDFAIQVCQRLNNGFDGFGYELEWTDI